MRPLPLGYKKPPFVSNSTNAWHRAKKSKNTTQYSPFFAREITGKEKEKEMMIDDSFQDFMQLQQNKQNKGQDISLDDIAVEPFQIPDVPDLEIMNVKTNDTGQTVYSSAVNPVQNAESMDTSETIITKL